MAYEKQTWKNGKDGGTPVSADRLNHIEEGIAGIELTPGPQGPKGEKGATGAAGAKGDKGDKGDTGPAGPTQFTEAEVTKLKALAAAS
jgi:hypothetical protein